MRNERFLKGAKSPGAGHARAGHADNPARSRSIAQPSSTTTNCHNARSPPDLTTIPVTYLERCS
ncbi:hypothetical protein JYU34_007593 [Plutella xylostella]|uniref:Uncharacterized protein n=1 Tax=Plutella xylostella TaxID=51655 RepID=A0ABQ7QQT9_PLUXY|nr:hypothetical protein JYU34_007593 [Plutella xylostella]